MTSAQLRVAVGVAAVLGFAGCGDTYTPPDGPYLAGWYEVIHGQPPLD